jgi:hypothetical protein
MTSPQLSGNRVYSPFTIPSLTRSELGAEGKAILDELPSREGILLFGAARDLMLWVSTEKAERGDVFPPGAGKIRRRALRDSLVQDQVLTESLYRLAELTDNPSQFGSDGVVEICSFLAAWARGKYSPQTELVFTQAAALAAPANPTLALATARSARDLGEFPRADAWFRYAIRVARQNKQWDIYVESGLKSSSASFTLVALTRSCC